MSRRRRTADSEREEDEQEPVEPAPAEPSLPGHVAAYGRDAGNVATQRLLRSPALRAVLARDPDTGQAAAPVDLQGATQRLFAQKAHEADLLTGTVIPQLLDRLAPAPSIGTEESLAELTVLARDALSRRLALGSTLGVPAPLVSTAQDIQSIVTTVAAQRNLIIPGHRSTVDVAGLAKEAQALVNLSGLKLPDLAIQATAAGFTFRFDGELSAKGKVGGTAVEAKGGTEGGEVTVGPASGGVQVGKDGTKVNVKVASGAVELKGDLTAKAGERTTWSFGLEIRFGGGAASIPDPAALAGLIQTAGENVRSAGEYLGSAVHGSAPIDRASIEGRLKPASESIGKVADYVETHRGRPGGSTGATLGITAKGDGGGASAVVTLTVTF